MFIEIFEHDILVADKAGLGTRPTGLRVLGVLHLRPYVLAVLADDGLPGTNLFMAFEKFRHDHLCAEGALLLFVKFFLR